MLGFVLSEALRDLRRAGRLAVVAVLLTALSLAAAGAFWILSAALGRAVAEARGRMRIIVYLKAEPGPAEAEALLTRVQLLPEVASARLVSKAEALSVLRRLLGREASVVDQLPGNPLPASLEVTPTPFGATPEATRALVRRLEALPEAEEVAGGVEWVERLASWRQALRVLGVGLGALLGLAAVLSVVTATRLILHARRQETEIMWLVGAPEAVIRLPLLLQGAVQGLAGGALALALLGAGHRLVAPSLEPLLALALGVERLAFLPPSGIAALLGCGAALGALGGWLGRPRPALRGLFALLLVLLALPAAAQSRREDRLQVEQRRLLETQRQLKHEREKAAEARRRESSLLAELEEIERRLADKRRELARLDRQVRRVQGEIATLRADIQRLEGYRSDQEQALARRLRLIYRVHAEGPALPLLLGGGDPVERAQVLRHLASVAALDARLIQEYRGTSDRLADRKAREEARRAELAELRAAARQEQAAIDQELARRRQLLARVRDERAYHERMVGELTEAARRLEAFVRELQARQRRLAKVPPASPGETPRVGFGALRGLLPWPTDGRIVGAFGPQIHPRFGTRTFRNGVDIEAAEGTEVTAVYGGHVVYTGWFKGYGNLIILDHGYDYYTLYAHMAEILVQEGDDVRQGQRIGTVGDTGSLSGPRLYFEVRFQGRPLDPAEWLRQRG